MPSHAAPLSPNPATSSQQLVCEVGVGNVARAPEGLLGWSAKESTGTASASFRLHDGTSASDPALTAGIALTSGESDRDWFGDQVVDVQNGAIFVEIVSGSVELVVYWA